MSIRRLWNSGTLQVVLLLLLVFFWAYWPTLERTVRTWQSDPDYTHGFYVLPIACAIVYRRRQELASIPRGMSVWGLWLVMAAALTRILGARYYLLPLDAWSIPFWIGGVVWCFCGWRTFRCVLPALVFLWFAAPLPERIEQLLSLPLQERAAAASAWVLQCLRQPAVAAGTTLLTGSEVFEVEHACSGLRMFLGSFAMATAFILLASPNRATSVALMLSAAPIAVFANVVRIVFTVIMFGYASTDIARRLVHDAAGLLMVIVVFLAFVSLVTLIGRSVRSFATNRDRFMRWMPIWPVGITALVIGAIIWHHRQQEIVLSSLLDAAETHEEAQDWRRASSYLRQYLQLKQGDQGALLRLGHALNQGALRLPEKRRALTVMTAAWKANPADLSFAIEQAQLALELHQYSQVVDTVSSILADDRIAEPACAEIRKLASRWRATAMYDLLSDSGEYAPFNWRDVAAALQQAIQLDPDYPQHAFRRAIVYRERLKVPSREERNQTADKTIDQLVADNPRSAEAWLVRYRYRRRFHRGEGATAEDLASVDADLNRALSLDQLQPHRNVHILVAAAERARERGNLDESLSFYELALRANQQDVRPYLAIASIWVERGTPEARRRAVNVLQQGLTIIGSEEVPLLFPLIEQLSVLGRTDEANGYTEQAASAVDRYPEPIRTSYRIQLQHVQSWRLAKRGEYARAADDLAQLLSSLSSAYQRGSANFIAQSWANAGQYYRMSGDWNQVAECYQRAAAMDDNWRMEYRWALAHRTEAQGDLSAAFQYFRDIANAEGTLDAWLNAATVTLRQQLLLPAQLRNWSAFRRAVDSARTVAENRLDEVLVLEANQLLVLGQEDRVEKLLAESLEDYPDSPHLLRSLALLQSRHGETEQAIETASRIQAADGDTTESLMLRKEILCRDNNFQAAIDLLRGGVQDEGPKQLLTLYVELAWLHMQLGEWSATKEWLDLALALDSTDIRVTEALSQLAWCIQDWNLLEQCEASLRLMEGSYGPLWRNFRIRRILAQSTQSDPGEQAASDAEVDALAQQLEVLYPHMQQTRIAAGRVATFRGMLWRAVANYEEAWQLGLPNVALAVDLIGLLNELGETEKAQRYVQQVRTYLAASQYVIDGSVLQLADESADDAIRLAEALVRDNPRSDSFLRLGRTLVLTSFAERPDYNDRLDRAENAFRQAVEIDPSDVRTWAALFRFLVSVRPDLIESQNLLQQLSSREDITQLNRTFALAQLSESIGNRDVSDEQYQAAIQLAKQHRDLGEQVVVLERAAQYFRRHQPELSETCCREALNLDSSALGPKQILLELLLAQQTAAAVGEAAELVASMGTQWKTSDLGRRIQTEVLRQSAIWNDRDSQRLLDDAIQLLVRITNKNSLDALRLADLYLMGNQRGPAIAELARVSNDLPDDSSPVLQFLDTYDQQLFSDTRSRLLADQIYDQLEELPDSGLQALDLRLKTTKSRPGDGGYTDRQTKEFSVINRYARRIVDQTPSDEDKFATVVRLMRHLVVTGRWQYAQQLTQLTPDLLPVPRTASALATALALTDPTLEQVQLLASQFDQWLSDYPRDSELRFAVANLNLMFGQYGQAIEHYRRCLIRNPNHAMVLNNLALALAFENGAVPDESLDLLDQAISLQGRRPQFLDSLALIRMLSGDQADATELILEAMSKSSPNALLFLHLARAWLDTGQLPLARYALSMAESRDLASQAVLPFDREMYEQLVEDLKDQGDDEQANE